MELSTITDCIEDTFFTTIYSKQLNRFFKMPPIKIYIYQEKPVYENLIYSYIKLSQVLVVTSILVNLTFGQ